MEDTKADPSDQSFEVSLCIIGNSLSPAAAHLHRTGISRREARRHQVVLSVYNQPPRHTGHAIRETAESNSVVHSSIANFPSGL